MYGFLILLPMTLISLLISGLIATRPQVDEYVGYIANVARVDALSWQLLADKRVWILIASHVATYAILCFALMATVRTISAPLPADRHIGLRFFQRVLEVVFVAVPSVALLWINGRALRQDPNNWIHWLTVGVLCVGLVITVAVTVMRPPVELYRSSIRPFAVTKVDALVVITALAIGATIVAFGLYPIESAHSIGMFPVLLLAATTALMIMSAVFSRRASPVAVISSLITGVLLLHVIDIYVLKPREFRYRQVAIKPVAGSAAQQVSVAEVKEQRKIPDLATAFYQWLEYRRPAIEAYKKKGSAYPVFFVSAQGGGIYAAYHPALSLARLTDHCPEFAHHLFGISSVSGGGLGAAVFAELLRTLPATAPNDPRSASAGCTPTDPSVDNILQTKVQEFFATDFLSPVIASAFIFDVPSLFVPQLRFGPDRAKALEFGIETAWRKLGLSGRNADGLSSDFLERWEPTGLAPALFMSTTGVNFGIPVLVSQVAWSNNPVRTVPSKATDTAVRGAAAPARSAGLLQSIMDRLSRPEDPLQQVGVANVLDFRPDIQLSTSTAVVLSARFPFVTPPGAIVWNKQIVRKDLYKNTEVLELTDGGFYENSGGTVAQAMIRELDRRLKEERFKEFKDSVVFHLIRFTDTPAKRQGQFSETGHFELITPFAAYDAVRLARGVLLTNPSSARVSYIYLRDEWYDGTLNWLLTPSTKLEIEKRSSWIPYNSEVCCEVRDPVQNLGPRRIPLKEWEKAQLANTQLKLVPFVPNARPFIQIIDLVQQGAGPNGNVFKPPSAAQAPSTPETQPPPSTPASTQPTQPAR
jgi:hypothetical protein